LLNVAVRSKAAILAGVAGALFTSLGTAADPATAAAGPTFIASTAMNGTPLPAALIHSDGWRLDQGVWAVRFRSLAPPNGTTTIDASWTPPKLHVSRGATFFATSVDVGHQGVPPSSDGYSSAFQICPAGKRCDPWQTMNARGLPDEYTSSLPYDLVVGIGTGIEWKGKPATIKVHWRFRGREHGADEQDETVSVAVGAGASTLLGRMTQ
jgi:hypothetical protein